MNPLYFNIENKAVFLEGVKRPKNLGGRVVIPLLQMLRPDKSGLQHDINILLFGAYPRMEG
jgi:hypothetical protein